jgi:8-oxo-dGTP diphosphatase
VLLERRPENARVTPGVWDVPGGHVERREGAAETLVREFEEELGVRVHEPEFACEVDALEPPGGRRYRHALFVVRRFDGEPREREGQHLAWFTPAEALGLETLSPPTGWALQEAFEAGSLAP